MNVEYARHMLSATEHQDVYMLQWENLEKGGRTTALISFTTSTPADIITDQYLKRSDHMAQSNRGDQHFLHWRADYPAHYTTFSLKL